MSATVGNEIQQRPKSGAAAVPGDGNLSLSRAGGVYIPPHKLRRLTENITDKSTEDYQRMTWEALKKSINGLINKVNTSNIKNIIPELFGENLKRGRGLFCRSITKAQSASLPFTNVYAAVVSVVNSKLPEVGELVLKRLVIQFRRAFRRNDKKVCLATSTFIAHLTNQLVAHEILSLQILMLLLEKPTEDSVEIAVGFMREVGAHLASVAPPANNALYERFRTILHEGKIDKRVQYMIEVLFQVRKDKYKDNQAVLEELDLVEEDDQITHDISLDDDDLDGEENLNLFKYDRHYVENEETYKAFKLEVLGEEEDESGSSGSEGYDSESESEEEDEESKIRDETNEDLVNLRRTIYLTVMSSLSDTEIAHKLLRTFREGKQLDYCNMIVDCCAQAKTYEKLYGGLAEQLCLIDPLWVDGFLHVFHDLYNTIHNYETNSIRNIATLFARLFFSDGCLPWTAFTPIRLTEDDTTSAGRVFLRILFEEIHRNLGLKQLKERLADPELEESTQGLFPKDNPRDTRFAINYWTSIGLGALTDNLREWLRSKF